MSLLHNKLFLFATVTSIFISATFMVGVDHYQTTDVNGVPVTKPVLNLYGSVLLAMPLILYILYYLKKRRWET